MACKSMLILISGLALTSPTRASPAHEQIAKSVNALVEPIGIIAKSVVQSQLGAWNSKGAMNRTAILQTVRRLDTPMSMMPPEIPAACKEACPGAESMQTELTSAMSSVGSDAGFKQMFEVTFDLMCKHPDVLQCMETNQAVCDTEHDEHGSTTSGPHDFGHSESSNDGIPDINGMGECFCTHCPDLKDAFITFFDSMMTQMQSGGDSSAQADPTETMKMMCPLIGGLKCAMPQPSCASVLGSVPDAGNVDQAEAACKAMGISTGPGGVADASSTTSLKLSIWIATVVAGFRFAF